MPVVPVPEHSPGPVLGAELPGVRRLLALPAQEVVRELGLGTRLEEPGLGPLQVPALVLPPAPAPAPGLVPGVGGGGDGLGLRPPCSPPVVDRGEAEGGGQGQQGAEGDPPDHVPSSDERIRNQITEV